MARPRAGKEFARGRRRRAGQVMAPLEAERREPLCLGAAAAASTCSSAGAKGGRRSSNRRAPTPSGAEIMRPSAGDGAQKYQFACGRINGRKLNRTRATPRGPWPAGQLLKRRAATVGLILISSSRRPRAPGCQCNPSLACFRLLACQLGLVSQPVSQSASQPVSQSASSCWLALAGVQIAPAQRGAFWAHL